MIGFALATGANLVTDDRFRDWVQKEWISQDVVDTMVFRASYVLGHGWYFDTASPANRQARQMLVQHRLAMP